ncbi:MAG: hypothetical protein HYY37_02695 [Candidatus Aenigmarchaeota archaeon]|nr:hypothetical protein [Candidatus Aenigmarchaeota archaeon]
MVLQDVGLILTQLTTQTVVFLPNLVGGVILLVIGLVIGKVVGRVVHELLDRVRLDYYVSETQKPVYSLAAMFSMIVRWWIYIAFITAAVAVLQVEQLTLWMSDVRRFVPNVIGAAVIMVVGYVLAEYIKSHLQKAQKLWATVVGKTLFFFVLYVSIALALETLGITASLVNNVLVVVIASVGLGVALALGLGLKDAVSDVGKRYVRKVKV